MNRTTGVVLRDLPTVPADVLGLVREVTALGVGLVHVPSASWFSADLDHAELDRAANLLRTHRISLGVGLGQVNALRGSRSVADLTVELQAAARLGAGSVHFSVGTVEDRESDRWDETLAATTASLRGLAAVAADLDVELVLKTHEDMTTTECLRMVEAVGPRLSLGFSPVNVLVRMEDPLAAAHRVAGHVHTVFLDDAAVGRTTTGVRRWMRPVGEGDLPWADILDLLAPAGSTVPVVLDLHRAEFDAPFLEAGWTAREPDLTVADVLGVLRMTHAENPSGPASVTLADRAPVGRTAIRRLTEGASV